MRDLTPAGRRIALMADGAIVGLAMLVFVLASINHKEDGGFRTIYKNLPLAESGNAKDYLEEEHHIAVRLGDNGTSLRVPKERVKAACLKLKNMPDSYGQNWLHSVPVEKPMIKQAPCSDLG